MFCNVNKCLNEYFKNFNGKKIYGFITKNNNNDFLRFYSVNSMTEKFGQGLCFPADEIKAFVDELYLDKNMYQAIIVDIFDMDVENTKYESQHELRTALKTKTAKPIIFSMAAKLNALEIPNYFMCTADVTFATYLIMTGINNLQFDETVLIVTNDSDQIRVNELKFTPNGYEIIRNDEIDISQKYDEIREKILGSSNPKKIIGSNIGDGISIKKFIKSKKLVLNNTNPDNYIDRFITETCKWILDKSCTKYHILPIYRRETEVCSYYNSDADYFDLLLVFNKDDVLPCSKEVDFPRSVLGCTEIRFWTEKIIAVVFRSAPWVWVLQNSDTQKVIPTIIFACHRTIIFDESNDYFDKRLDLDRNECHRLQVTLSIDDETMETFSWKKITINEICLLPLQIKYMSELPIVGLFDNSSVILIYDELFGYNFLKSWNGE
uniref:Uncharacterized protein n=1 Tax=Panagrolaimus davidi TaxID=227884 RepID=A0A914QJQ4_9BILA